MFDKLYKEANDSIPVNVELMERLKSEATKEKSRNPYRVFYRYGLIAAAVLIVTVSLNVLPELLEKQKTPEKTPGIVKDTTISSHTTDLQTPENSDEDKTDITSEETITEDSGINEAASNEKITRSNKKTATPQQAIVNENSVSEAKVTENVAVETDVKENTTAVPEKEEVAEIITQDALDTENPVGETETMISRAKVSGGGSSAPKTDETPASNEIMNFSAEGMRRTAQEMITPEEYCRHFGFLPENWAIPTGMKAVEKEPFYIGINPENGEYDEQSYALEYIGEDKRITVTMFPDGEMLYSRTNSREGEKYREGCVIENYPDLQYSVYLVRNGRGYIIETKNLEKEMVYVLIDSIS